MNIGANVVKLHIGRIDEDNIDSLIDNLANLLAKDFNNLKDKIIDTKKLKEKFNDIEKGLNILETIKAIDKVLESFQNLEVLNLQYKGIDDPCTFNLDFIFDKNEFMKTIGSDIAVRMAEKRNDLENKYFSLFPEI